MTTTSPMRHEPAGIAWGPVLWVAALHAGALLAFIPAYFTWRALLVALALHWLTGGVGICLAYHRLLTHRSFATRPKWLEYALTALGCCASEGGPIGWVAAHRQHHAHSDDEHDLHSPGHGFGWAHMRWWMARDGGARHTPAYQRKWAPDLARDPVHRALDRLHLGFPLLLLAGLYAVGGLPWLIWGGFVRSVAVLHSTWLVNSAAHVWGYRTYATRDRSTNLWWVALLCYGEGWHNNHHAAPTSARHGLRWWELDMTYGAIRVLAALGLARGVKLPGPPPATPSPPKGRPGGPAGRGRHEPAGATR